jgi:hypothetical protein
LFLATGEYRSTQIGQPIRLMTGIGMCDKMQTTKGKKKSVSEWGSDKPPIVELFGTITGLAGPTPEIPSHPSAHFSGITY